MARIAESHITSSDIAMTEHQQPQSSSFGGTWTKEKLNILERYLDAYTTALKDQPFKLMYIDAFAGSGKISLRNRDDEESEFLNGSATMAVQVEDKSFDRFIFIEKDLGRCASLSELAQAHPSKDIRIVNADTNRFLRDFNENWRAWRGVLFLDPFATEVEWSTIKSIADFNALDTWILCPVNALARMLPRSKNPKDISEQWVNRLNRVFGGGSWENLYRETPQKNLFGDDPGHQRDAGVDGLIEIYKNNLSELFGPRFLRTSRTLRNSKNSPLFEFLFCVGHERGIGPATRIAEHILERL